MIPLIRLFGAIASMLILASCLPTEESSSQRTRVREDGPVQAYAALTNFPANTGCLRFTSTKVPAVADARIYEQLVAVTPGAPASVAIKGLPFGVPMTIMAEAFAETCPYVEEKSLATWLNEAPVTVTLAYGQFANTLAFKLRPVGGANTSIDFLFFTVAPLSQAFGSGLLGDPTETVTRRFTVANASTTPTGVMSAMVIGPEASSFQIVSNSCVTALPAGGSCWVEMRCVPKARGALNATLLFSATPGGAVSAPLTGTGMMQAFFQQTPSEVNYGTVAMGQVSAPSTITVKNSGDAVSGMPSINIEVIAPANSPNQFELLAAGNTCTAPLNGGQSCSFQVRFAPKPGITPGNALSYLEMSATPGTGQFQTKLIGLAAAVPGISITPAAFTFPYFANGIPTAQAFAVKNLSGVPLPPLTAILGGANPAEFQFAGNECNATLPAGASCNIFITALPAQPGLRSGNLTVNSIPGISLQAAFTVTATPLLVPNPASIAFGNWSGAAAPKAVIMKVTNTGLVPLPAISFNADPSGVYKVSTNGCNTSRAPGSVCDVAVSFDPPVVTAATNFAFSLVGTANAANKITIPLTGTGTP